MSTRRLVQPRRAGPLRNKIVRLRSDDGLTAVAVEEIPGRSRPGRGRARPSHQIQQCSFGPDGKLYVFVADGPSPPVAADDGTFNGKVLRLNPDGTAPPDNPKYDPANPTAPISYQYTKGHRNAFGMAWRPSTGQLYLTENGPERRPAGPHRRPAATTAGTGPTTACGRTPTMSGPRRTGRRSA